MGYIGQSRSERSQEAINAGLVTKNKLKAWQKRAVETGAVKACEWHHTGKYFNKTYYYDPSDFIGLNPKDFPKESKAKENFEEIWFVLVSAEWGGTRNHPRITGVEVKVTNKITDRQRGANKYFRYGGHIEEFKSETEAREYAKIAELEK